MKVSVAYIEKNQNEQVIVQCYEINDEVSGIINYIKSTDTILSGYIDDKVRQIYLQDIFYVESVDNRCFAYLRKETYEIKCKLYEFENVYRQKRFFRCSKAVIVNLMKIETVHPALNGRLSARLFNGEEIIISRQYSAELKNVLLGGKI